MFVFFISTFIILFLAVFFFITTFSNAFPTTPSQISR